MILFKEIVKFQMLTFKCSDIAQTNKDIWSAEELASVGELLLDISIQLAKK